MTIKTHLIGPVWLMAFSFALLAGGRSVDAAPGEPAPPPGAPAAPPPATATTPPATAPVNDPNLPPGPLTLAQALGIAYQNNGNIVVAESNLAGSRHRVTEARAGTLPKVTGGINYSGRGVNDIGAAFGNVVADTSFDQGPQPTLQLQYNPFDSGQTRYSVRSSQANVRAAEAGLANTRVNLGFDVTSNFVETLRSQKLVELSQQQVRQSEEQLQFVEARIAAGTAADVDRYQIEVELANARVTLLANQNLVRQNAAALRASMGLPVGPAPTLSEPVDPKLAIPPLEEAVAEANRNHPQIQQDLANIESARYQLKLAEVERRPVFKTVTSLNVNPRDERTKSDWTILASLSMPLWDAGVTRARQQEARYQLVGNQALAEQTRVDISTSVQQAILNMQSAQERLDASAVAVDSATRNLEAANARYQQGVVTVIEITTAQVNSFDAQNNAISAKYDYYLAYAQLQRALGRTAVEPAANVP
jgi:outer membrane protein